MKCVSTAILSPAARRPIETELGFPLGLEPMEARLVDQIALTVTYVTDGIASAMARANAAAGEANLEA